jgi:predicted DNA-binding transcriptional regulator YafY
MSMRATGTTAPTVYLSGSEGDYLARWKRIILIDQRLRSGALPGVKALAGSCGVSVKTIRRDLEAMRLELAAPIEFVAASRGYRYTDETFAIPAAALSERDLFALMVAENAVAQYEGTPLAGDLRAAFDKVLAVLPGEVRDRHALAARAIHFGGLPPPSIRQEVWAALAAAIDGREQVELDYHRAGAREPVRRCVHPYQLLVRDRDWFLVAYNPDAGSRAGPRTGPRTGLRTGPRTGLRAGRELLYYLPRIAAARRTGRPFRRRAGFDADAFHRYGFNAMQGPTAPQRITLRFAPQAAYLADERPWAAEQTVRRHRDGSASVTFRSAALFEVERQVLRYGGAVVVVAPRSLRASIARTAHRIGRDHGAPTARPGSVA